jgi:hypothetical protein
MGRRAPIELIKETELMLPVHALMNLDATPEEELNVLETLGNATSCAPLQFNELSTATHDKEIAPKLIAATVVLHCADKVGYVKNFFDASTAAKNVDRISRNLNKTGARRRELAQPDVRVYRSNKKAAEEYATTLKVVGGFAMQMTEMYTSNNGKLYGDKLVQLYDDTNDDPPHPAIACLGAESRNPLAVNDGNGVQAERLIRYMLQKFRNSEAALSGL